MLHKTDVDGAIIFVGEIFSRICRRGSAGKIPTVGTYVDGEK